MERRIYNPVQKDYVTFIETSADTLGKRTLVEVELAPGGGVGLHYHKTNSEKFDCLEGELKVEKTFTHLYRDKPSLQCPLSIIDFSIL